MGHHIVCLAAVLAVHMLHIQKHKYDERSFSGTQHIVHFFFYYHQEVNSVGSVGLFAILILLFYGWLSANNSASLNAFATLAEIRRLIRRSDSLQFLVSSQCAQAHRPRDSGKLNWIDRKNARGRSAFFLLAR